jgi:hypothetical protein
VCAWSQRTRELVACVALRAAPRLRRADDILASRTIGARAFLPLQLPTVQKAPDAATATSFFFFFFFF